MAKSYVDTPPPRGSWRPLLGEILDTPLTWYIIFQLTKRTQNCPAFCCVGYLRNNNQLMILYRANPGFPRRGTNPRSAGVRAILWQLFLPKNGWNETNWTGDGRVPCTASPSMCHCFKVCRHRASAAWKLISKRHNVFQWWRWPLTLDVGRPLESCSGG